MIDLKFEKSVAIITLNRGVTNAINLEVVQAIDEMIRRVRSMPEVHALVLSSANEKFFCIGFDIPQLYQLGRDDFSEFYSAFNQTCMMLYTLPKPTVAALRGHAVAGGSILALCCDYRVIARGHKLMGLNEIKLGVPMPYLADCILQSLVGTRVARDVVESGEFFEAEELLKMGLVDEVVPQDEVMRWAMEKAELLSSMPTEAYQKIKENRVEQVEARVRAKWEAKQRDFVDLWCAEDTRQRLWEAMQRF